MAKKAKEKESQEEEVTLSFSVRLRRNFKCDVRYWRLGTSSRLLFARYAF